HAHTGPEQMVLVVDLGELEGGSRAIPPPLRLLDVGVVELALKPSRRGELTALGGLDPHGEPPGAPRALSRTPFRSPYHMFMKPLRRLALTSSARSPHVRPRGPLTPATCHAISSPSSSPSPCSWRRWIRR